MTIDEFLVKLTEAKNYFQWRNDGCLRDASSTHCPITAVAYIMTYKKFMLAMFFEAGKEIGLDYEDCRTISVAADGRSKNPSYSHELRCKLEEILTKKE